MHAEALRNLTPGLTCDQHEIDLISRFILDQKQTSTQLRIHLAYRQELLAKINGRSMDSVYAGDLSSRIGRERSLHEHIMKAINKYPVFLHYAVLSISFFFFFLSVSQNLLDRA